MIEFRLRDFFSPVSLIHWRYLLWKSQFFTPEKLLRLQKQLLERLLLHCSAHVPRYRQLRQFDYKDPDLSPELILQTFPVIDKEYVNEYYHEFLADNRDVYRPKRVPTSGTTGRVLNVLWDRPSNILELLCQYRHFSWTGYRLGDPFLDIRSVQFNKPVTHSWNWRCRGLELSSDRIDHGNIDDYAELIRNYGIRLWRGHPSAIADLCILLKNAGHQKNRPCSVITASETLWDYQREIIEAWTGVRVCESYGLKEHNALITQCPEGGYHINAEYGIVEIIKEDGSYALPGEEGRIVGTGLHQRAFPLIRYDTGDYAVQSDKICPCGRTLPLIEKFTGRIDDRLMHAGGFRVSGLSFAFHSIGGIRKSQLVQNEIHRLEVYIVPDKDFRHEETVCLVQLLKDKLGAEMEVIIRIVDEIPFPAKGKTKFVICTLPK